jgi:nucleotide-binding universal stress UspA family protein
MTTYLIGIDASEHSRDALRWALAVATPADPVVAVHAWALPVATGYEGAVAIDPAQAEASAQDFVRAVVAELGPGRVDGRVAEGAAGRALVDAVDALGSDDVVVVVGHGGSGKASLLLGSTAQHVVHHAAAPVVVVRGDLRIPVRRIVVGLDGFDEHQVPDDRSMVALRWALRLPAVAQVHVAHADFVPAVAAGPVREPGLESDQEIAEDDSRLRHAIQRATDGTGVAPNGAEVVPVVAAGTGGFALIEASRDADLVVVGTRGRPGLVELILGSTTLEVLAHSHCPVAVVR